MNAQDKLRLTIIYNAGGTSYKTECVVSCATHEDITGQVTDCSREFVCFQARLNDIDGNLIDYMMRREDIHCIEAVTVNGME